MQWRPSATIERLRQRAAFIASIRTFFAKRDVLEVETPALSQGTITDLYLDAMKTQHPLPDQSSATTFYLQTSPEFAMKRLLAAGAPDIFQISKCFREDEIGRLHNPEFTMLEWYRRDFSMQSLIDEVSELLKVLLSQEHVEQLTYQQVFMDYLSFDPLTVTSEALRDIAKQYQLDDYCQQLHAANYGHVQLKDALLQALFSQEIESKVSASQPVCITHFPASQAALAKLSSSHAATALRFEFYYRGIELANGFEELCDAQLQQQRFEADNKARQMMGKPTRPIDQHFIDALREGLPPCSGVALGIDRLLMLALNCDSIAEVMSFDIQRA